LMLGLAALALLGVGPPLRGQGEQKESPRLDLDNVWEVPQVYVSLRLRASDRQLFVPYCGKLEVGSRTTTTLCTAGTHLEVQHGAEWLPAKLRRTFGILGGERRLDLADVSLVAPRTQVEVEYLFSRRYFEVEPGQKLRVIVDVWPDEQSMRSGGKSTQIASPPFECPHDFIIR